MATIHNTQELGLGWLYVITHPNAIGLVKIGITDRPERRMDELDNPTVLARVPVRKPRRHEQRLHQQYQAKRVPQTEWFRLDENELAELFKHLQELAKPFLALVVLPPEPPAPAPPLPPPPPAKTHPDRYGNRQSPAGRQAELRRKLKLDDWREEMLRDHGLL